MEAADAMLAVAVLRWQHGTPAERAELAATDPEAAAELERLAQR